MTLGLALLMALVLGLVVGSFLNVVIERLPRMMERRWREDCAVDWGVDPVDGSMPCNAQSDLAPKAPLTGRFNLAHPPSHCPQCLAPIRWHDNIPLWGFLRLRGRCRDCGQPIPWRVLWVEALTGAWFAWCVWAWGPEMTAVCWALWGSALIALAFIDAQVQYLPDDLTLPLCWAGLLAATLGWIAVDPISAIWGAAMGYLLLWGVAWAYERWRQQVGMGQGDFKLLAALGAWLGWQNLSLLLLIACVLGLIHGLSRPRELRQASPHFAFGPSLCLAGFVMAWWGRGQPVLVTF